MLITGLLSCALAAAFPPAEAPQPLAPADLEAMLEPIALYPDSLLANVFAASIYPLEVVKAGRLAQEGAGAAAIDSQDWEPAVKAVAKVPVVIQMMSENLDWTEALGAAFLADAQGVMAAVQRLREQAFQNGALHSGKEVTVVEDDTTIVIESASPDVVYVPVYEPAYVYPPGSLFAAGAITFGAGVLVGAALDDIDCDWHHGDVCWDGDVDIDIENKFKSNTEINNRFERNTSIEPRERGEAGRGTRPETRPGREGTAWRPNQDKLKPGGDGSAAALDKFRGAGGAAGRRGSIPSHPQARTGPAPGEHAASAAKPPTAVGSRGSAKPPSSAARSKSSSGFSKRSSPSAVAPAHKPSPPSGFSPSRSARDVSSRGARSAGGGRRGRR